ncbi:Aste57867_24045 [Aphanomyces stellatus]|uniref:Aste57867_24045 protein n=1 Tax=Aphanomyces stellatus TaxID=120398 RepID=A0A485LR60_9STRA|nr:hypothetical protein As57867_023972 [Aphanomyces stellatus]VFU00688.1 Aste57867_24045 [Aphanomyces stellatus]
MSSKCALIIGAGDSTGAAVARAFAADGLVACCVRRDGAKVNELVESIRAEGYRAEGFGVDCRDEENVQGLVNDIETKFGPIEVAVFNVGANVRFPITETTSRVYRKVWEMACFSGFLVGREVAARMAPRRRGTIIFTGATASVRGSAHFAAFSSAKFGLRALSQSMARELGPEGIHVAHLIVDGAIDTPWIHENFPQAKEKQEQEGLVDPTDIAKMYVQLHHQPKTAWTHELDVRPWVEKW